MPRITSRIPLGIQNPYRPVRPASSKIVFLSCEGCVTEEDYFERISELFDGIKSKIQFISVAEDAVHTAPKGRTPEQKAMLSKARPKQLVERIEQFKVEKESIFQFSEFPDDEFWIVTDVDKNWSDDIIDPQGAKSYKDEWNEAISLCQQRNYGYAVSNPFFEVWLLLHHDSPTAEDKAYAVTDQHAYDKTIQAHFRARLGDLGCPLRQKSLDKSNYTLEKVKEASTRAEELHQDKTDLEPHYFATTVYILLNKLVEMLPQEFR